MSDMEEDEDYGFEYETDDDEEQDVDIENQVGHPFNLTLCYEMTRSFVTLFFCPFAEM